MPTSIAVVGGGIAGLAAAHELASNDDVEVTLFERDAIVGGRVRSTPFAGLDHIDEGADAFLARVPDAVDFARSVGLGDDLVHPEAVGAAVWHGRLHPIPEGLLLGVPGAIIPIARSGLLSWRGKLRAAIEPLLPRTSTDPDSIGDFVRARFGDEVHERLVDALVGSIYATDTDRFSLAEVPQLATLARRHRSLLLGARATRAAGTATSSAAPIFAAPRQGIGALARAAASSITALGGTLRLGVDVQQIAPNADGWDVDGRRFDRVALATPAAVTADLLAVCSPESTRLLRQAETADVILVTLHIDADEWPERLHGRSGYLVPKPVQRTITAVSFGSQKWAHWRPPTGGEVLRVSLGRDGQPVMHLSDEQVMTGVLDDLRLHLGVAFSPREVRISRWPGAFAQYRPHHSHWVDTVEASLPEGVSVTGASFRGIGIPACVREARTVASRAVSP